MAATKKSARPKKAAKKKTSAKISTKPATAKKAPAKKKAIKKPPAKKATKPAAAKKAPVKKKATKKPIAKKAPPKKKATKKPPAKKATKPAAAKKAPVKKKATKKFPAKKAPVKKKVAKKPAAKKAAAHVGALFLTGFPGFVGKHLVEKIIHERPQQQIYLMVQEKFAEQAKSEIDNLTEKKPHAARQLHLLSGDLTHENLGLGNAAIKQLQADVSEVWHIAAVYDLSVPEKIAWNINVEGTRRVLDLCGRLPKLNKLVYFSTCYVSGLRTGLIVESDLDYGQGFKNHYESTKFEAEVLVQKQKRVPAIIIRPSIVIGNSQTGETDKFDGPYFLIRALADLEQRGLIRYLKGIPLPSLGKAQAYFNIIPIDYLIDAVWQIANNSKAIGKTFQVCDPDPLTMRELYDDIYQHFGMGRTKGFIPVSLVRAATQVPKLGDFLGIPEQSTTYVDHYTVYDCQNTMDLLKDSGIHCPPVRSYLATMIDYVRQHVYDKGLKAKY